MKLNNKYVYEQYNESDKPFKGFVECNKNNMIR